jgi:hypothetical protein
MLGWLVRRRIASFARDFDYDMSYAGEMDDASPRVFCRFSQIRSLGFRLAQAVPRRAIAASDGLRRQIVTRWGNQAPVSLALTIACSRVDPGLKYALGHVPAPQSVRPAAKLP